MPRGAGGATSAGACGGGTSGEAPPVLGVVAGAAVVGVPAAFAATVLEVDGAGDVVAAGASVPFAVVPAAGSLGEAGAVLLPVEEAAGLAGCSSTGGGAVALWLPVGSLAWVEGVVLAPVGWESASVATFTDPAAGTGGAGSAGGNW
ncbi:MAG TPA: hypothetical protein VLA85_20505, partial [Verrucomicrobiae bacterium]|nr:hypothetical protein [Verrucomicrobiae bacterium]